ncbi:uncharacterized protein ATC70_008612 [Mucor velutinosus]|uniref:Uncharacterized protein n=1 Tax=Mucor velutinosus TaxID=708070 RepID=A0AAN7DLX9_9FUNG|nr:hypothetical protein ATC70_008612 [Mucor velutinosus]
MVDVIHRLMTANAPESHSKLPAQGTSLASSSAYSVTNDTTANSTLTPSWADIIFPARYIIGILLHEANLLESRSKLLEIDISPISYFNPIGPNHIADSKYQDLPQEDRTRLALIVHQDRCLRTLSFIRPNLLPGIYMAKYFICQGWIPTHLAQDILNKRIPHPVKQHLTNIPHSSVATVLQQFSQSSDINPAPPSTDLLPEASTLRILRKYKKWTQLQILSPMLSIPMNISLLPLIPPPQISKIIPINIKFLIQYLIKDPFLHNPHV